MCLTVQTTILPRCWEIFVDYVQKLHSFFLKTATKFKTAIGILEKVHY